MGASVRARCTLSIMFSAEAQLLLHVMLGGFVR